MSKHAISPTQAIAISLGSMIGWGAFVMPGDLFLNKTNFLGSLFAFALGTALIILVAHSYIRLMNKESSHTGGAVAWVKKYVGITHARIYSWAVLAGYIAIIALNASAIVLLLRTLLPNDWNIIHLYQINGWDVYLNELLASLITLALFALVNYKGLRAGASIQLIISLLMVIAIVSLTTLSIFNADTHSQYLPNISTELSFLNSTSWLAVLAVVPWAYVGFETTPHIAKNIRDSQRKTKYIVYLSLISGFFCYILVNYLTALNFNFDYSAIHSSMWATGEGIRNQIGSWGMVILALAMIGAILSGINGFMLSTIKLLESMNDMDLAPKRIQHWFNQSPQQPPIQIISIIFIICTMMLLLGRNHLLTLVNISSFGIALGFVYIVIADIQAQKQRQETVGIFSYLALGASLLFMGLVF
ncbi:APC family permease [Moraxella sp. ZY210820]|uniref:APC family permease n=1 Tax=unclassified Moraxella TaxID=2685852 RepID=UPI0027302C70|nr:APC family permease [Moraxella sp. ZY210820]WLF83244.1 APC family permease [Moraxella sp. ZY210820]